MMHLLPENLAGFLVMTTVVSFMPGPAVLFVLSQSVWRGHGAGLLATAGIQVSNTLYFVLTGLGLAGAIAASGTAFTVIKWLGVAYLAWLGFTAIRGSFRKDIEAMEVVTARHRAFRDGIVVALGNPKSILYFVALLPQFIDPERSVLGQAFVLWAVACGIDLVADLVYVFAGGMFTRVMGRTGVRRWFERGVGGVFLGISAMLALARRGLAH